MQAYRGMDIGTAKPESSLRERLPHHLIDILDPGEQYTAGDFVHRADQACAGIAARGRLPVVSGGTGFYLRNFMCGLPTGPAADPGLRAAVAADLQRQGADALRAELAAVDPVTASRIAALDLYRLTRAVEILRASGRPPSDFAPSAATRKGYRFLVLGIARPREELNERIALRVQAMVAAGLAGEFASLAARGYGPDAPGMAAIGYREFFGRSDIEAIKQAIILDTRRYAKRQMTFFRALPGIEWIHPEPEAAGERIARFLDSA